MTLLGPFWPKKGLTPVFTSPYTATGNVSIFHDPLRIEREIMIVRKLMLSALAVLAVAGATVVAEDVKLEGIKCVVAPRPADASKSADYKGGKVYFCCGNCAGKFAGDSAKFATTANAQLVATKQFEQKSCPLSGGAIKDGTEVTVAGATVKFCCNNCQGKVKAADEKAQLDMVFGEKAFEKAGFAKVKPKS